MPIFRFKFILGFLSFFFFLFLSSIPCFYFLSLFLPASFLSYDLSAPSMMAGVMIL